MPQVTAQRLIRSLPREHNFQVRSHTPTQEPHQRMPGARYGFVKLSDGVHPRHKEVALLDRYLVMRRAQDLRGPPSHGQLRFLRRVREPDRVGRHRFRLALPHQRHDDRGIEPTR